MERPWGIALSLAHVSSTLSCTLFGSRARLDAMPASLAVGICSKKYLSLAPHARRLCEVGGEGYFVQLASSPLVRWQIEIV
jgi:hypothetical protein